MKASKKDPQLYGGYRTATAAFAISVAGVLGISSYATVHILEVLDNFNAQEIAATQAEMYRVASAIEEYKSSPDNNAYPSAQDFKKAVGPGAPMDYWDRAIRYESSIGAQANSITKTMNGTKKSVPSTLASTNFELRSAGPDGVMGTDDDIVMRNGIFITNPEQKKFSSAQQIR